MKIKDKIIEREVHFEPRRVDMARPVTVLTKNVIGVIGVICD